MYSLNDGKLLITNIQRFSLHDGPGIRTTVFLKGCSLRCPWCCNPENIENRIQKTVLGGKERVYGRYVSIHELYKEIVKDTLFYTDKYLGENKGFGTKNVFDSLPGGVTFSGGEPLLQIEPLEQLCTLVHKQGIHITVESSLFASKYALDKAIGCFDLFYVDIKIMDFERAKQYEGGLLNLYLDNLQRLLTNPKKKLVIIRIPVIGGYTDNRENRHRVREVLGKYADRVLKVELLREHSLGLTKYSILGWPEPISKGVSRELMEIYREELKTTGIPIEVCDIINNSDKK